MHSPIDGPDRRPLLLLAKRASVRPIAAPSGLERTSSSVEPPVSGSALAETTILLPFGGRASSRADLVRMPLIRPFWLLALAVAAWVAAFVALRLLLGPTTGPAL